MVRALPYDYSASIEASPCSCALSPPLSQPNISPGWLALRLAEASSAGHPGLVYYQNKLLNRCQLAGFITGRTIIPRTQFFSVNLLVRTLICFPVACTTAAGAGAAEPSVCVYVSCKPLHTSSSIFFIQKMVHVACDTSKLTFCWTSTSR